MKMFCLTKMMSIFSAKDGPQRTVHRGRFTADGPQSSLLGGQFWKQMWIFACGPILCHQYCYES